MGKQGPCYHCGITSTPLWRNGPPEKPVLCNACGSRWRTKGTLTNYTPLHAREHIYMTELGVPKVKPNEQRLLKRKQTSSNIRVEEEHEMASSDQNFHRVFEEDISNRSSSGSAISYSESCSHFGGMDTSDLAGSVQCNLWDSLVPSRKRTCVNRTKPSPVEKLTRDLYSILHKESSNFSQSLEDDLLYETKTPIGSVEIGNGGVLIRQPNTAVLEEESEASSLPIYNKTSLANEAYSGYLSAPVDIVSKEPNYAILGGEKVKRTLVTQDHVKRDKVSYEKSHILRSRDSPLSHVDLTEVINFEGFMRYLTNEEHQQVMKYLPSVDTSRSPESLASMFHSPHFVENISYFKQLLVEGIFDSSCSEMNADECRTLKKLVLGSLAKAKWVEHYTKLKDIKNSEVVGRKGVGTGPNYFGSSSSQPMRRPHDRQNQKVPERKALIKSPKQSCKVGITNLRSLKSPQLNFSIPGKSSISETNEYMENDASFFSPRSFFASPPDRNSMLDSLQFNDESSDQDLLLDVHSNVFPETELLSETWKQTAGFNSVSAESGIESISYDPISSSTSQQPKQWNG